MLLHPFLLAAVTVPQWQEVQALQAGQNCQKTFEGSAFLEQLQEDKATSVHLRRQLCIDMRQKALLDF